MYCAPQTDFEKEEEAAIERDSQVTLLDLPGLEDDTEQVQDDINPDPLSAEVKSPAKKANPLQLFKWVCCCATDTCIAFLDT